MPNTNLITVAHNEEGEVRTVTKGKIENMRKFLKKEHHLNKGDYYETFTLNECYCDNGVVYENDLDEL